MRLIDRAKKLIEKDELNTNLRVHENVFKRVAISNLLRIEGYSTTEIGKLFNRDHSTVVHYSKRYQEYKDWNDFNEIEMYVAVELELETTTFDEELEPLSLPERIVRCNTYWQFRKLRDKVIDELSTIDGLLDKN